VDPRVPDSPVDHGALEWLLESERPVLVLAAKADKLKKGPLNQALVAMTTNHGLPEPPLPVSAHDRSGLDALWSQLMLLMAPS
jgi:GTP-binding protein EngB required for normal cell division